MSFLENEVWYEAVAVDIDNNGGNFRMEFEKFLNKVVSGRKNMGSENKNDHDLTCSERTLYQYVA